MMLQMLMINDETKLMLLLSHLLMMLRIPMVNDGNADDVAAVALASDVANEE